MEQKNLDSTGIEIETDPEPVPNSDPDPNVKPDEQTTTVSGLSDPVIRQKFLVKVYGTLTIQMFVVILLARGIVQLEKGLFHALLGWTFMLSPIVLIPLTCHCRTLRRISPGNLILLLILSLCEGVVLGAASFQELSYALTVFAGIILMFVLSITLFTLQKKLQFTWFAGFVLVFAVVVLMDWLVCRFPDEILQHSMKRFKRSMTQPGPLAGIILASFFAGFFCLGLLCDTWRLLRIQGKDKLQPDDYIYTAFTIKLDIFNIFFLYSVVLGGYISLILHMISSFMEFAFGVCLWPRSEFIGVCGRW